MTNGPVLTHLLLGLCGVLALVDGAEWAYLNQSIRQSRQLMEQPVDTNVEFDQLGSHEFVLAPKESFSEIVERPLMIEGRRPVAEEPENPIVASPATGESINITVMGIVMTPNGMTVLLHDGKGAYQRLQMDGMIDGWEVEEIHPDRVIMKQGGTREELKLRKPKPKNPLPELQKKRQRIPEPSRKQAKQPRQPQQSQQPGATKHSGLK